MATYKERPTSLITFPRISTLIVAVLVSLCSGTNYVYSAYGPQLGARLGLTHTQQNMVGLGGNMGVYTVGPFVGKLVDAKGPRIPLTIALVFLSIGYFGMKVIFDSGSGESISTITFFLLVFCSYITGVGGNGGMSGSINSVAKSFPDQLRSTTTGLVLSGFGLSAFLFSTIAHAVFPGNTSDFLLVLAVGTSLPMLLGLYFIRTIPLPGSSGYQSLEAGDIDHEEAVDVATSSLTYEREDTHLLEDTEPLERSNFHQHESSSYIASDASHDDVQLNNTLWENRRQSQPEEFDLDSPKLLSNDGLPNLSGRALFATLDFWLLFTIMSLLSGIGLMWINNVGSITQALLAKDNPNYDDVESSRWQSIQVSTVSIMNCTGRICMGLIADFVKNRLNLRRTYCILLVALLFFTSQIMAILTSDVQHLYKTSAMLGFSYGGMFGLFPSITIEWFGLAHFSENWGLLSLSPVIGGNLFSLAFGRNLDAHTSSAPATSSPSSTTQCVQGVECYVASLYLTIGACLLASVLAVWAGWRDKRRHDIVSTINVPEDVVWDQDE